MLEPIPLPLSPRRALGVLCVVPLVMLAAGCGGDGLAQVGDGLLSVSPEQLTFNPQGIGENNTQFLTLENVGTATLVIDSLDLNTRSNEFALQDVDLPLRLEPGEQRVVEVSYTPADCEDDRGSLNIGSNDRTHRSGYTVPLQPQGLGGQVQVHPSPIDFGRVPAGTSKTIDVTVTNVGTCALEINDMFLSGSYDFSITEPAGDGIIEYDPQLPIFLEPAASYTFDVTFTPSGDGFDEAVLLIRSDDARNRTVETDIIANGGQPCIVVTDEDGIDFGARLIGAVHQRAVTITNCSPREDLLISSISLGVHGTLAGADRYALSGLPPLAEPYLLPPQEAIPFTLSYAPELYTVDNNSECRSDPCELVDGAVLTITSNDEVKNPLDIDVRGLGSNNDCPVAVARARVQGGGGPWDTQLDVAPLVTLEFDGRDSSDSEGEISSYLWEVASRPDGSTAPFAPNAQLPNPTFFMDLAGPYVFTLRVFDSQGTESCDAAEISALVVPTEAIHVQLVWETPGDSTRNDTGFDSGSDVDLHFMRQGDTWDGAGDCHWKSCPGWGGPGITDDPSLDIDDTDGWGPENINLDNPPADTYLVGAFYYDDWGYGPSDVTVRIFLQGVRRFESTLNGMENYSPSVGQFWDVARITWPSQDIVRINRLFPDGFP